MTTLNTNYDQIATTIASMSREEVKYEILHFNGRFHLDFPEEFLDKQPLEKLRHILLAARMQQSRTN